MAKIKHLEGKYTIARYELIIACDPLELKFYLWLKLWAINKHSAWPSYATIIKELNITKPTLSKLLKDLENKKRLKIEKTNGRNSIYDITWYDEINDQLRNFTGSSKETLPVTSKETLPVTSKETLPKLIESITNRNITNITIAEKTAIEGKDINLLLEKFKPINPSYQQLYKRKNQREALARLVHKYTYAKTQAMITALPNIITQKYAPQITTPMQLEDKLGRLLMFIKSNNMPRGISLKNYDN